MGETTHTPKSLRSAAFNSLLPLQQFEQLHLALQQFVQGRNSLTLTEATLSEATLSEATLSETTVQAAQPAAVTSQGRLAQFFPERFLLVVSDGFSALLTGDRLPLVDTATATRKVVTTSAASDLSPITQYQVQLSFEPAAISDFLDQLIDRSLANSMLANSMLANSTLANSTLQQAKALLHPNDAQMQSQFTLHLVQIIGQATPPDLSLQQQVEQEYLLNQVITQIRQSLELPEILQIAVEQVRQCLQVDRLVIYQLESDLTKLPTTLNSLGDEFFQPATVLSPKQGFIAHESRISEDIPSVLHLVDRCSFAQASFYQEEYQQGLTVAIDDVTVGYAAAPCLVEFLQHVQVRSKLIAPIRIQEKLWGFLIAHACEPRTWHGTEQRFLQQIAEHLSVAIWQAQLYAQLQQQKQTLEQRVVERTQELRDVLLAAQAANRAKSEFLAAVTHELLTPLTCIIGMSTTLQRWSANVLNDRQRKFLQGIHDSGEQLLTLINDMLDLSQAEAGKMVLNLSEFSLTRFAQQTIKVFEEQASAHEVDLELDMHVDVQHDRLIADARRMEQIMVNLLDNAIKFTPHRGKVTLRVFSNAEHAIFQVKDSGIGIPSAEIPQLFQKFHQLDAGHRRQYQGTGLGLALTKQLVDLHSGSIDVESTVGLGSVFTVRLPLQQPTSSLIPRARLVPPIELPKGRIVLIENREESADVICDVLTAAGYQLIWMLEGATAIDQIEILRPIAVILNVQLPDIDGYHLIHNLRQNPTTKQLKIIALVSDASAPQPSGMMEADASIMQSIRPDLLLQQVMSVLGVIQ